MKKKEPKNKIRIVRKSLPQPKPGNLEIVARRTNSHLYLQALLGNGSFTILNSSSLGLSKRSGIKMRKGKLCALLVGRQLAIKTTAVGIQKARFNRLNFKYHGLIKMLAEAARNYGLCF
ncbi:50S ribosomal subunit protein L18 [Candidatus Tremblaya phenacola PAVE]|nr:50S ribosomal subunit protein L18 [Candidatus Tremblaya phenacola PAVE]